MFEGYTAKLYISFWSRGWQWKPRLNYIIGEPTHFVHPENDFSGDGVPLNKSWDISFSWGWFLISVSVDKGLPYQEEEKNA